MQLSHSWVDSTEKINNLNKEVPIKAILLARNNNKNNKVQIQIRAQTLKPQTPKAQKPINLIIH
jgi:hypothetical protein